MSSSPPATSFLTGSALPRTSSDSHASACSTPTPWITGSMRSRAPRLRETAWILLSHGRTRGTEMLRSHEMPEVMELASRLESSIEARTARVGVIGLGYVGLPLVLEFHRGG